MPTAVKATVPLTMVTFPICHHIIAATRFAHVRLTVRNSCATWAEGACCKHACTLLLTRFSIFADGTSTGYIQADYGTGTADPAGYGQQTGYDQQEGYGTSAYGQQGYGYSADGSYGASDATTSAGHAGYGTSQSGYPAAYAQASNWLMASQTSEGNVICAYMRG